MKILKQKKYQTLLMISKYSFIFIFCFAIFANFAIASKIETSIKNPLGTSGPQDIPGFIETALNVILTVGVPLVVIAIIYSGFLYVSAQGNPEKLTKAHKNLLYSLIGAALLLGAFVIANAIGKTVKEIGEGA